MRELFALELVGGAVVVVALFQLRRRRLELGGSCDLPGQVTWLALGALLLVVGALGGELLK